MPEPAPGHIGDVKQTIHAIEIDKRAEVRKIFDGANHPVADVHAIHEFLPLFAALLLDHLAPAKHDVFAVVVKLDDFKIVRVANELLQIFWRDDIDLRCRQKCLDADVHHQAAFHHGFYLAFDQAIPFENMHDLVPVLAVSGFFLREHDHALVVFEPLEQHVHLVAHFGRVDVIKFRYRNDALGFVSDVDQHFARANFQYSSLDDASLAEVRHRLRHHILHLHHKIKKPPSAPAITAVYGRRNFHATATSGNGAPY